MKRIFVAKHDDEWMGTTDARTVAQAATKTEAVRRTVEVAKADPEPVTVRIHMEDGRIQEERNYPAGPSGKSA